MNRPNPSIRIQSRISAPVELVWRMFTTPSHIQGWNFASPEWHCPAARVELIAGGGFSYTMAARDGSMQFDLEGTFEEVTPLIRLRQVLADGRHVSVDFTEGQGYTTVTQTFQPETQNSRDMQKAGWQAILDNFGRYAESQKG